MVYFFIGTGLFLLFSIFSILVRAIKGPTVIDRLLCINVIGTKSIILIVFCGFIFHRLDMFIDIAIGYGLLNYIASICAAKYYQHYRTLNPENEWVNETKKVS